MKQEPHKRLTQVSYINAFGRPIEQLQGRPRRSTSAVREPKHKGWVAVGFSPLQLERGAAEHAKASARAAAAGAPLLPPFDPEVYMRRAKPGRVRSKPYEIRSAAEEACRLAGRSGWIGCHVQELVSG